MDHGETTVETDDVDGEMHADGVHTGAWDDPETGVSRETASSQQTAHAAPGRISYLHAFRNEKSRSGIAHTDETLGHREFLSEPGYGDTR